MLAIVIVICIFLYLVIARILGAIEKKYIINNEVMETLENLNERIIILEKKVNEKCYMK